MARELAGLLTALVVALALSFAGCSSIIAPPPPSAVATATTFPSPRAAASPASTATLAPTARSWARVVRVIDGDTIEIEGGIRVRYIGIDTPETYGEVECYGPEATAKNRELVEGKRVRLEKDVSETDRYGRLLRYVYIDDIFVNAELVRLGYAQASAYPPDVKHQDLFRRLGRQARERGLGLWNCPQE